MDKKQVQLGMNPSTASGRLIKDLLYNFVIESGHVCFRCEMPLTRETFSIEHMVAWLDSKNPIELFFDPNNIAYSHLRCNSLASRRYKMTPEEKALAKKRDWQQYYAKKKEQVLERKRNRYNNPEL